MGDTASQQQRSNERIRTLAGFAATVAVALWLALVNHFDRAAAWLLTGDVTKASGFKLDVSNAADQLGKYRVEIVVLAMIAVAVALGTAYDITMRRFVRRVRR